MAISRGYCPQCDEMVVAEVRSPSHLIHFVVTIFTAGLWFPIWVVLALSPESNCRRCGCRASRNKFWWRFGIWVKYGAFGFVGLIVLSVVMIILFKK